MSILVITTITGTFNARAIPKCSLGEVRYLVGYTSALSLLAHSHQTIISSDHQQTVVGLAAQHSKYSGAKVSLMTCQISEADDFGLRLLARKLNREECSIQNVVRFPPRSVCGPR